MNILYKNNEVISDKRRIESISASKVDLSRRIEDLIHEIEENINSPESPLKTIESIRNSVYENINQYNHEALILELADRLDQECEESELAWYCHPHQSGGSNQPDLQGRLGEEILFSCEVTTSRRPVGTIRMRMRTTLKKLLAFSGKKVYAVRTEEMQNAALKIIHSWGEKDAIDVVCIPIES